MKKKSLLIAFSLLGASTLLLGGSLKASQNTAKEITPIFAYSLDEYKSEVIQQMNDYVDIDSYPEDIQRELRELVSRGEVEINNASREYDVDCIWSYIRQCMDEIIDEYGDPEARELNEYKQSRIEYIEENLNVESFPEEIQHEVQTLINDYIDYIDNAESKTEVDEFYNEFLEKLNELTSENPLDPEPINIAKVKQDAIDEIYQTLDNYDYTGFFEDELLGLAKNAEEAIRKSMSIDEVATHLSDFHDSFNEFPTSSTPIAEVRHLLINKYNEYEGARLEQSGFIDHNDVLVDMYEEFESDLFSHNSVELLFSIYAEAIGALNNLMPLGLKEVRNNALDYITTYLFPDFAWCFQYELSDFVPDLQRDIGYANTIEDINKALAEFKYKVSFYPTDVENYLTELREGLTIQYIYYVNLRMEQENIYLDEDTLKTLENDFINAIGESSVNKIIHDEFENHKSIFEDVLKEKNHSVVPEDPEQKPEEKEKNNTGLIVACAVEGGVIVLGGAAAAFFFLKKKKAK